MTSRSIGYVCRVRTSSRYASSPVGRHIGAFLEKAEAAGKPLPISISIGVDPAIYIGTCFEAPTTPLGFDELQIAGSIRKRPVELVHCVSVNELAIANAEVVIEAEILPKVTMREDEHSNTGFAMPEFPGYNGVASLRRGSSKSRPSRIGSTPFSRHASARVKNIAAWKASRPRQAS